MPKLFFTEYAYLQMIMGVGRRGGREGSLDFEI